MCVDSRRERGPCLNTYTQTRKGQVRTEVTSERLLEKGERNQILGECRVAITPLYEVRNSRGLAQLITTSGNL